MSGKFWHRPWRREKSLPWRPLSTASLTSAIEDEPSKLIPQGLSVIFEGSDPVVDIIAVHGLNGHREKTWRAANGTQWLRDLLPMDIPQSRIVLWGYDSRVRGSSRISTLNIEEHAQNLISDLCLLRQTTNTIERPIILVAHSLGGLIVKSALIHSDRSRHGALRSHRSITLSTYAVIYIGTPHQGGNGAQLGQMLANIASVFVPADDHLIRHLRQDSEWLQQQAREYSRICDGFVTKFAYEEYETPTLFGHSIMVVPRSSAVPVGQYDAEPIVIHADHKNIVKYSSREDPGYKTICGHLQILVSDSSEHVQSKWKIDSRIYEVRDETMSSHDFSLPLSLAGVSESVRFIAREKELQQLHIALQKPAIRRIALLHGLGGVGKTQLSVAYIKAYGQHYSSVIWFNSRDEISIQHSFSQAAERILQQKGSFGYIKSALDSCDPVQILAAVKRWLNHPHNTNWLLVFDNYDNPDFSATKMLEVSRHDGEKNLFNTAQPQSDNTVPPGYDIRSYFPSNYQGAIIVTSRIPILGMGEALYLRKFQNISESLELLRATSHREDISQDSAAIEISRLLDGLPLALSTAGAYLHQVSTSCSEYLQLYRDYWLQLQQSSPMLLSYENRALYSTWDVSYAQIKRKSEAAAMLLRLWAYFDNEDLWYELLEAYGGDDPSWFQEIVKNRISFDAVMRILCNHGLVEVNSDIKYGVDSRGYSVHQCVHAWMKHALNPEPDGNLPLIAMKCVSWCAYRTNEAEKWKYQKRLLLHAEAISLHSLGELKIEDAPLIYEALGSLWADQYKYERAATLFEKALKTYERRWGSNHITTLKMVFNLAGIFSFQERYIEAENNYLRALEGFERLVGSNDTVTLNVIGDLAVLYARQERFMEAEARLQQALAGKEMVLGPDHHSTLHTVNNLGTVATTMGQYRAAESLLQRALRGKELLLGANNRTTLNTVHSLGLLYKKCGHFNKAETYFNRSLHGREEILEDQIDTLDALIDIGDLYIKQGHFSKAETALDKALEGFNKLRGPAHQSTVGAVYCLARLYMNQTRHSESEAMYQKALQGYENTLGRDSYSALMAKSGLGELYRHQHRYDEATKILEQVLQSQKKVLSATHPSTLSTVNEIGLLLAEQQKFDESYTMYARALEGYEQAFGKDADTYLCTLNTLENIGDVLCRLGKPTEARNYYCRVLPRLKDLFGCDSVRYNRIFLLLKEM